jgi:pimeloyl-ACP methyl ester carboxylesterase
VPSVERDDGVSIHWEMSGDGPLVVLVPYVNAFPDVWAGIIADLERDHRVLRYDARGTGESTRRGPYDPETAAADLEAVIEAAGGPAVVIAIADAILASVHAGAARPDLVTAVLGTATAPLATSAFAGTDAMAASSAVVGALIEQLGTDYRGALRTLLTAANPQMSDEEVRERVRRQEAHSPQEAAVERLRNWAEVDPGVELLGVELGDRLWMSATDNVAGPWFPGAEELIRIAGERFPEAHLERIEDGLVSRPDETAALVRRITGA